MPTGGSGLQKRNTFFDHLIISQDACVAEAFGAKKRRFRIEAEQRMGWAILRSKGVLFFFNSQLGQWHTEND